MLITDSDPLGLAGCVELLDGLLREVEAGGLDGLSELSDAADAHDRGDGGCWALRRASTTWLGFMARLSDHLRSTVRRLSVPGCL